MSPAASILIPAHDAAPWIGAAIDSALAQSAAVEVVVVDDGSSDATPAIVAGYDGRIRWETGPRRGAPAARNRLLELARAPFVQYLDADDALMPDKVAAQLAAFERRPDADIVYGPVTVERRGPGGVRRERLEIPAPRDPWALLALWRLPQTGAPLFRRAALEHVGGWRVEQPCCQEHELYLRLLVAGHRFVYDDAGGAIYRSFPAGTLSTRDLPLVRRERLAIERRIEAHLAATGALTPERQWAIDQARFDMARSAWPSDRAEARTLHGAIASPRFAPRGAAAPVPYRLAYRLFGFAAAERIAAARRALQPRLAVAPMFA